MPTYEYYCAANNQALEVQHSMSQKLQTWGELCKLAGVDPGNIALDAPVDKLMSAGNVLTAKSSQSQTPSGGGSCCGGGGCGY
ncbi:MAG: zinc ribbon domain-containing protein [Sumerlaeia bacterium]